MKKLYAIIVLTLFTTATFAQSKEQIEAYIDSHKHLAVQEMFRTGVPASITIAQGIIETAAGTSPLYLRSNNNFGIKCKNNWMGKFTYHDDDAKGECFRVYDNDSLSYVDHSNFLRNSARYAFLFNFDKTDYKSWALGLRQAGYATNPSYTAMVIKNIEEYNLDQLDVSGSPKNVKLVKKQPKFLADEKITSNSESVSTNLPSSETNGKAEEKLSSDNNYPTVHWNVKNIDATPIVANAINVKRHPIYNSKKAKSQAYAKKKKTNNKTKSALAKNTKAKPIAKKSTASVANKKHSKNLTRN